MRCWRRVRRGRRDERKPHVAAVALEEPVTSSERLFVSAIDYGIWLLVGVFWLRHRKRRILDRLDDGAMTNDDIVRFHGSGPEVRSLIRDGRFFIGGAIAVGLVLLVVRA